MYGEYGEYMLVGWFWLVGLLVGVHVTTTLACHHATMPPVQHTITYDVHVMCTVQNVQHVQNVQDVQDVQLQKCTVL